MNAKETELIDFEIKFFEGIIQDSPSFTRALMALGDLYTKRGDYEKGLAVDLKLIQLCPTDPIVLYNLACSYSLTNDVQKAFETIKRAIECGYDNFKYLLTDPDLKNVNEDDRFQTYLSQFKTK